MLGNVSASNRIARQSGILLFASAVVTLTTACAPQGPAPELHAWHIDGTPDSEKLICHVSPCVDETWDTEVVESQAAEGQVAENQATESNATSEPSYQYRGGRDLRTGLAHLQM